MRFHFELICVSFIREYKSHPSYKLLHLVKREFWLPASTIWILPSTSYILFRENSSSQLQIKFTLKFFNLSTTLYWLEMILEKSFGTWTVFRGFELVSGLRVNLSQSRLRARLIGEEREYFKLSMFNLIFYKMELEIIKFLPGEIFGSHQIGEI